MKKTIEVVFLTDFLLKSKEKNKEYLTLWSEIATSKGIFITNLIICLSHLF